MKREDRVGLHKPIGRYSIGADSKSFGERICLAGPVDIGPRMSENTMSTNLHRIYESSGLQRDSCYRLVKKISYPLIK